MEFNTSIFNFGKGSRWDIDIRGRRMAIECSPGAVKALEARNTPLFVVIEIAMACFAKKSVTFTESGQGDETIDVTEKLAISVQTVAPNFCKTDANGSASTATPTMKEFIPKWLRIDYRSGEWRGDCGFR